MDVQTKLRENRKAVMLKQYKLDSMKHRAKALNPKITSVIYSDNADNVLITYNDGKCKKTNFLKDINDESKLTSTTLKTDGKRVSNIQLNKMFPTTRYAWTYDEKSYVVKPGVVYEVGSGSNVDMKISEIDGFNLQDHCSDLFFKNYSDDYEINIDNIILWQRDSGAYTKPITDKKYLKLSDTLNLPCNNTKMPNVKDYMLSINNPFIKECYINNNFIRIFKNNNNISDVRSSICPWDKTFYNRTFEFLDNKKRRLIKFDNDKELVGSIKIGNIEANFDRQSLINTCHRFGNHNTTIKNLIRKKIQWWKGGLNWNANDLISCGQIEVESMQRLIRKYKPCGLTNNENSEIVGLNGWFLDTKDYDSNIYISDECPWNSSIIIKTYCEDLINHQIFYSDPNNSTSRETAFSIAKTQPWNLFYFVRANDNLTENILTTLTTNLAKNWAYWGSLHDILKYPIYREWNSVCSNWSNETYNANYNTIKTNNDTYLVLIFCISGWMACTTKTAYMLCEPHYNIIRWYQDITNNDQEDKKTMMSKHDWMFFPQGIFNNVTLSRRYLQAGKQITRAHYHWNAVIEPKFRFLITLNNMQKVIASQCMAFDGITQY